MKNLIFITIFLQLIVGSLLSQKNTWIQKSNHPTGIECSLYFSNGEFGYWGRFGNSPELWQYSAEKNEWTKKKDLPFIEYGATFTIDTISYVLSENQLWAYHPKGDLWVKKSVFPGTVSGGGFSFVVGVNAYIGMGIDRAGAQVQEHWEYNSITNSWRQRTPFPGEGNDWDKGRLLPISFAIKNKGYVGMGVINWNFNYYASDLFQYDPVSDTWTKKSSLPATGRYSASGFSIGNKGYVLGGERRDPVGPLSEFWEYDESKDTWTKLPDFAGGNNNYLKTFVIGNKVYSGKFSFWSYEPTQIQPCLPDYVPTDGLVGYWPFCGDAKDESGNGNDGVVQGPVLVADRFGTSNSAYAFNNNQIKVNVPNSRFATDFTISNWIWLDTAASNKTYPTFLIVDSSGLVFQFELWPDKTQPKTSLYFLRFPNIPGVQVEDGHVKGSVKFNQWMHLSVVNKEGINYLYVNGILVATSNARSNLQGKGGGKFLTFGYTTNQPDVQFIGKMDDVGIWDRALTDEEILQLYTGEIKQPCLPDYVPTDGLLGYWPFCGDARDESGNGNDGVVNGAEQSEDRNGNLAQAFYFEDASVDLPIDNTVFQNDFTASFWARLEDWSSAYPMVLQGDNCYFDFGFSNDGAKPAMQFLFSEGCSVGKWSGVLHRPTNPFEWHHYTVKFEKNIAHLFIDGILVDVSEIPTVEQGKTSGNFLQVGKGLLPWEIFRGWVDEVAIYNRALSEQEVQKLTGLNFPSTPVCKNVTGSLTKDLIGYWPLCGNAKDSSGKGNDGVLIGAKAAEDRHGNANQALFFDNRLSYDNDWIKLPVSSSLVDSAFSISIWSRLNADKSLGLYPVPAGYPAIFEGDQCYISNTYAFTGEQAFIAGYYVGGNCNLGPSGPGWNSPVNAFEWTHSVYVSDGDSTSFYVNGRFITKVETPNQGLGLGEYLKLGRGHVSQDLSIFNGWIDDVGVWKRALNPAEITSLYNDGKTACLPDYVPTDGLVGYWPFCGDARDESGNGNDGVVNGATLVEDREGNTSSAYYFNGNLSNRIAVDLNQPMPAFGDKTFSIWMKIPNEYIHPYSIVLEGDNQVPGYGNSYLSTQGNEPSYINANTVGRFYEGKAGAMSTIPLNDDQWHHVVLINKFKDSKSYVYIDGMLNTTKTALNNYLQDIDINTITIGNVKEYWQTNAAVLGSLDDIGIWNRALTHTEIKALYQGTSTPIDTALTLALDTLTLTRGETAVLPVRVRNFSDILSGQGTFTFDPAVVEFQGVEAFGLDSLTAASFNLTEAAAGRIMMAWNQNDANPVTLADGATLFAMRFKALGSNTQFSAVNFASNPVALEFAGSDFNAISPVTLLPGRINTYSEASVAGQLLTESGDGIRSATLTATTPAIATTLSNLAGNYKLNLPENVAVTLTPSKGNDTLVTNGITVADVLRINRHILRITSLSTPYRIIAADVNQSGTVSSVDINLINALILGRIATYPSGKLWSFVPADHVFSDPAKPFPYPSTRTYPSFREVAGQDFIGMKLGDVDNSYSPMESRGKEGNPVRFYLENQVVQPAASITVPVRVRDFDSIAGFQFGLQWNPAVLRFTGVSTEPSLDGIITGQDHAADGWLNVLWTHAGALSASRPDDDVLLWLSFDVVGAGGSSTEVRLFSSATTPVQVVHYDLYNLPVESRAGNITVSSPTSTEDVEPNWQLSVSPNPFAEEIAISIRCAQSGSATLTAYDQSGRQVSRHTLEMQPGIQVVREGATWPAGVYLLRLTDASGRPAATFKVIRQ